MRTQTSPDLAQVLVEAQDIARNVGQPFSSTHLLLALFTVPNGAQVLLRDRGITEDGILDRIQKVEREPVELVDTLVERARTLAAQAGMKEVDCLHLLVAVLRTRDIAAHRLLLATGVDLVTLRNQAMSYLTGNMPRRVREATLPLAAEEAVPEGRARRAAEATGTTGRAAPGPVARGTVPSPPPLEARQKPASRGGGEPPEAVPPAGGDDGAGRPPPAGRDDGPGAGRPSLGGRGGTRRPSTEPPPRDPDEPLGDYDLDPAEYPWLSALGRNLTQLAADGAIDPVIGREREIEEVIDVLGKRRTNNPVLVGEPGVGKTAIVEGLAQALLDLGVSGHALGDKIVIELDMASVLAGTHLRGSFSEKLNGIKEEVRRAGGRIVVFIDELHTLIGAGATGEGPQDAANELKAALARGEFPCVGATTYDEYRKFIEQDSALERRFTPVLVAEPGLDHAVGILEGLIDRYADHHGVTFEKDALEAAVHLSARYVNDRCLPDKAIAIIDLAGSRARRENRRVVDASAVARVISKVASVPEERLLMTDRERFLQMEARLGERVVGHGDAIGRIAQVVRRNYAGFDSRRPMGSFLFLGPTGVGKTETAKALAEFLFGSADALIRCDMSEYGEANTSARLIGAPPGYVGYGDGGQLTEPVRRRPFSVVLLDEVEKAHGDVLQLLLQILDEGQLTDSRGRQVTFANTVVLLTSNLGSEVFTGPSKAPMGFGTPPGGGGGGDGRAGKVLEVAQAAFPPELWNRIDERLVFEPLSRDEVGRIAELLLAESSRALSADKRIDYTACDGVIPYLIDHGGYDPAFGARPMRQTIQRLVEAPLAERILGGEIASGDSVEVRVDGEGLVFERARPGRARK